jgi:hypothetical protein
MGFLDPKQQDDEELPGSGLHLDLEVRRCPQCRREVPPWQEACPECGIGTISARDLPPAGSGLPDLSHLAGDDEPTGAGDGLGDAGDG